MFTDRRRFLHLGLAGTAGALLHGCNTPPPLDPVSEGSGPLVLSTWDHGLPANAEAMRVLNAGGSVLDAVELGVRVVEADLTNRSVGLGGMPDRDGFVTLDASIMDHDGHAGAVAFLQGFMHPISIARAVMERTPHVLLVGQGAEQWALQNGFARTEVDVPEVRKAWQDWLESGSYEPVVNVENLGPQGGPDQHDTIGMVAMDLGGRLAGSCTTSGMAWKVHGRVGDSPIIGAGLFVDGEVGAACATGVGELVLRTVGSHAVVERMRQGMAPEEACRETVRHILRKNPTLEGQQVGFIALRRDGIHGGWGLYNGFTYAVSDAVGTRLQEAGHERTW